MTKTRIYRIARNDAPDAAPVMIEATNASQAIRHVVAGLFTIAVAGPLDIVKHMKAGGTVEQAKADPETPGLPGIEEPTSSGMETGLVTVGDTPVIDVIKAAIVRTGSTVTDWNAMTDDARRLIFEAEVAIMQAPKTEEAPKRSRNRATADA